MTAGHLPLILIVDNEALILRFAVGILAECGWRVVTAGSGEAAIAMLDDPPALIFMDLQMAGIGGAETVAAIRAGGGPSAGVPIIAFTTTRLRDPSALIARGFDGHLAKPCTPDELAAAAERWRPGEGGNALARLEHVFGAEEIRAMTARLRTILVEALACLDTGEVAAIAHRVAGIAGMLGFAELGGLWLAVSEGEAARRPVRDATRKAIAAIDRDRTERGEGASGDSCAASTSPALAGQTRH